MEQKYRIDRVELVSYPNQRRKAIHSARCRYWAKSRFIRCECNGEKLEYVNFRGSLFSKVKFNKTVFWGCDFWGSKFNNCVFSNVVISNSVLMSCQFKNCVFTNVSIIGTAIVNSCLIKADNLNLSNCLCLTEYPECSVNSVLMEILSKLKLDKNLKKNKLLHISDTRLNMLNLFLLLKVFSQDDLIRLLPHITEKSTKNITTYKKLEDALKKSQINDTIQLSRPTQSRGCDANKTQ